MNEKKYFQFKSDEYHSHGFNFEVKIDWIVEDFISDEEKSGYIVQHFRRESKPVNFQVADTDYFEAWHIVDGQNIDHGCECDDSIAVSAYLGDALKSCFDTKGYYKITCDVYWIPSHSDLYATVDSWKHTTVEQAKGLKSSWDFPLLTESYHVVHRPIILHEWSLLTDEEIKSGVLADAKRYCPRNTSRDHDLVNTLLNVVFDDPADRRHWLKQGIYDEWQAYVLNK